jgi:hypothetical protein
MNDNEAMTNATVSVVGGNVIISDVHHGTSEGFLIVVPSQATLPVELHDHYYDDRARRVVVESTSHATLADALRAVAALSGKAMAA